MEIIQISLLPLWIPSIHSWILLWHPCAKWKKTKRIWMQFLLSICHSEVLQPFPVLSISRLYSSPDCHTHLHTCGGQSSNKINKKKKKSTAMFPSGNHDPVTQDILTFCLLSGANSQNTGSYISRNVTQWYLSSCHHFPIPRFFKIVQ